MRKHLRLFLSVFLDVFREDLGYHSASLTYQFLTVIGSLFMLLGFASTYLPFLEPSRVYEYLQGILPSYASVVFEKLMPLYKGRATGSLVSFILAYYFSLSFAKSLNTAFGFLYRKKPVEREIFFWVFMPLLILLYAGFLSLAVTLLTLSKSYFGGMFQRLAELLNFLLVLIMIIMIYSSYFRLRRSVFLSSILVALMLFLLNKFFSTIMVKLISASPMYSVLGSPLLFLVWLYYSFFCLLFGVRVVFRLDQPFK
ncbi:MAG: YhjD/YihY/BrkB family envelope integrity protein [Aquificaceae bacterium]|nr:YihY/virulence factor BrkB family protein [Aquificaceae bacterium]MDW8423526.1 YhjD/YihY/BrkB family envelope integrity protein [Aquificaceae bacterium]